MPKCNPRCPLVREQLRKIAVEAPWLLKDITTNGDQKAALLSGKFVTGTANLKRDGEGKSSTDLYDADGKRIDVTQTLMDTSRMGEEQEMKIHTMTEHTGTSPLETKIKTSATQWSESAEGRDRTDRASGLDEGDIGATGADRARRMDKANATDRIDTADVINGTDSIYETRKMDKATFQYECEPDCPRRISREIRIRKLEETQCIVDNYLLNKGARYFDDVCTCSLSCVVRALRRDPFVTSTLASIVLFTIGVKLCSELDAWYLPMRFS